LDAIDPYVDDIDLTVSTRVARPVVIKSNVLKFQRFDPVAPRRSWRLAKR